MTARKQACDTPACKRTLSPAQSTCCSCPKHFSQAMGFTMLCDHKCWLQIHESKEAGVYVAGLQEDIVTSPEHVLQLLEEGERCRRTGETKMNKNSSRSHTMFRMVRTCSYTQPGIWVNKDESNAGDVVQMLVVAQMTVLTVMDRLMPTWAQDETGLACRPCISDWA